MINWVLLFALILLGLLTALVVFGALMLNEMKKMTKISKQILYATTGMQSQMQVVEHDIDTFLKPFIHQKSAHDTNPTTAPESQERPEGESSLRQPETLPEIIE